MRHPFVEASIDKASVRRLAAHFQLDDLAELPSAPCLSSRVETGLRIDPVLLPVIDRIETHLRESLAPKTVRCRIRKEGIVVELDESTLTSLGRLKRQQLIGDIEALLSDRPSKPINFAPYRQGNAFLRDQGSEVL